MEGLDEMEDFLLNLKYKWKCKPYSNKWRQEERKSEKNKEKFIFVFFPAIKGRFSCRVWCGVCWPIWLPKPVCRNDWGSVQKSEWIVIIFVSIFIKIGIHGLTLRLMLSGSCLVEENFCKTVTPHISRIFFNPLTPKKMTSL